MNFDQKFLNGDFEPKFKIYQTKSYNFRLKKSYEISKYICARHLTSWIRKYTFLRQYTLN